jgi:Ca2+-binding RTX toxin-like protein
VGAYNGGDVVRGQGGDDACLSVLDGEGDDTLSNGAGTDTYHADAGDEVVSGEVSEFCDGDAPEE